MKEIMQRLKQRETERGEELPDDVTRDKHLRSLRREMRTFHEKDEKKALIKELRRRKKQELREHLFGITGEQKKKVDVLKNDFEILKDKNRFKGKGSMLGKGGLL